MKKNVMMRLASGLLIAVLLTTCAIAGTFAKYTTSVSSQDSARVAKWGFDSTSMDITTLFNNVYDVSTSDYTVESAVDVIAPGTQGFAQFKFAYDEANGINAPEVDYTFEVDASDSVCATSIQDNANIQWKLDDSGWLTWTNFIAAIEALDGDKDYEAGELPVGFGTADNTHTIYWRWVFTTGNESDVKDTAMGNADDLANVKIVIKITATQID